MITLHNYPLQITPSNAPHWWTVSSSLSGQTNFNYVFDLYLNKNGYEKVARLKTRPNEFGYANVDFAEIVYNQLIPNIRATSAPIGSNTNNPLNIIPSAYNAGTFSNVRNTGSTNTQLWHVCEYRVALGEEYFSGGSTILNIDSSVSADTAYSAYTITIYPGVQDNKFYQFTDSMYATGTTGQYGENAWKDFNQFNYKLDGSYTAGTNERKFLNAAGDDSLSILYCGITASSGVRYRNHHPECPIIISFFGSKNGEFCGNVEQIWNGRATGGELDYNFDQTITHNFGYNFCSRTELNERIVYTTWSPQSNMFPNTTPYNRAFWATSGSTFTSADEQKSEVLVYKIKSKECLYDPIHIVFLNGRGAWDSYSFAQKNIRKLSKSDATYAQSVDINRSVLSILSYEQREVIYDYNITEMVDAETWYMDENDKVIIEELFLSPYTYIFKPEIRNSFGTITAPPTIIPVKIDTNSWSEFKNRYNKLYQYGFTFSYNPINQKRRQG